MFAQRCLFLLSLSLISINAFATTYELPLPGYPVETAEECRDRTASIGETISRATGVTVLGVRCERRDYTRGGYELTVRYNATRQIAEGTKVQDPLYGSYASGEMCEADLGRQVELFRQNTGLTPDIQYCSPEGYLYIHSFRASTVKPRWFSSGMLGEWSIFDVLVEDPERLTTAISAGIAPHVQALASVRLRGSKIYVLYYDQQSKSFEFVSDYGYASEEECNAQKVAWRNLLYRFGGTTLAEFCLSTEFFPVPEKQLISLVISNMSTFYGQIEMLYKYEDALDYESLAACEADKANRIRTYQSFGWQVYGAICSMREDTSVYSLNLYRRE